MTRDKAVSRSACRNLLNKLIQLVQRDSIALVFHLGQIHDRNTNGRILGQTTKISIVDFDLVTRSLSLFVFTNEDLGLIMILSPVS